MSGKRYTDEFRIEAVKQLMDRGHQVADVAERLGVTTQQPVRVDSKVRLADPFPARGGRAKRDGGCHDNFLAEGFFQLLERERIKRRIYATHGVARADLHKR